MDPEEQLRRNHNILATTKAYENLLVNADFLKFREGVNLRMETLLDTFRTVDRKQDGWEKKVTDACVAWQEANFTYNQVFLVAQASGEQARSNIQELSKAPDQPS